MCINYIGRLILLKCNHGGSCTCLQSRPLSIKDSVVIEQEETGHSLLSYDMISNPHCLSLSDSKLLLI